MKSNIEWKRWAQLDPLYAVATVPDKSRSGSSPWSDHDFYEAGSADWAGFVSQWEAYGVSREDCLEIGCGAGRMTRQLARYFGLVHAIDISPEMIDYARRHVASEGVRFSLTDGQSIPLPDDSMHSAFSTHVFQHLDSTARGEVYFREIYRVLEPGGTMMIHVPVVAWPNPRLARRLHGLLDACRRLFGSARRNIKLWAFTVGLRQRPTMRVTWYELVTLHDSLERIGFKDIQVWISFNGILGNGRHPFVLARK